MSKTHFKKAFNSPYLGSQDLPDYKDINLTIERVELQQSAGLKENSKFNIAYFTDVKIKPMLLNSTNSKIISKLAKSVYIEDWVNIEITLMVKQVKAFGDIHDALRIREVTRKITNLPVLNNASKKWGELIEKVMNGAERKIIEKYYSISDAVWSEICDNVSDLRNTIKIKKQQTLDAKKKAEDDLLKKAEDLKAKEKQATEKKIDKFLDDKEDE